MNADWHDLIHRHLAGLATDEEVDALQAALKSDAESRALYLDYMNLDVSLEAVAARAEMTRAATPPAVGRARWNVRVQWRPLAMAAVLILAAIPAGVLLQQASASPAAIVRRALKAHAAALDRCYRVAVKVELALQDANRLPATFENRLWTRGDRFWIETASGGRTLAWGRDGEGTVWFALSPELGIRVDASEVGERLALHCELRSLHIESLLHHVLADFDLRREPGEPGTQLIYAQLKPDRGHPLYRAALMEVDSETGVLRRVELDRMHRGQPVAKVSFTLVETNLQSEAAYTLAGHLTPQAKIYDRSHEPGRRGPLLARQFLMEIWQTDAAK